MWEAVASSNIKAVNYDAKTKELHVLFNSSRHYCYHTVDLGTYRNFMDAASKGKFLNAKIKQQFNVSDLGTLDWSKIMASDKSHTARTRRTKRTARLCDSRIWRSVRGPGIAF